MNEKQFETKFQTAVMMFAVSFQKIMEDSSDALAERIAAKAEENPDLTVDEMTKEICIHVVNEISKQFNL